jgi:hypothetical protein
MKDRVTNVVISTVSGLGTALAGARWWAVLLTVLGILLSTYGAVIWLATRSPLLPHCISTPLITITWDGSSEPEEPPPKR